MPITGLNRPNTRKEDDDDEVIKCNIQRKERGIKLYLMPQFCQGRISTV
jgi:hypothetical protein